MTFKLKKAAKLLTINIVKDFRKYMVITLSGWMNARESHLFRIMTGSISGVDYNNEVAIFASMGRQPAGPMSIDITKIYRKGSNVFVQIIQDKEKAFLSEMIYPFTLVKINKSDLNRNEELEFIFQDLDGKELASIKKAVK